MLKSLSDWLSETPASLVLQTEFWIVPTLQSVHILAIAMLFGALGWFGLHLIRDGTASPDIVRTARPMCRWAGAALLVSGTLMVLAEPDRTLPNVLFQVKMGLLVLLIMTAAATFRLAAAGDHGTSAPRARLRGLGALALALLVLIIIAGRWIAYVE